MVAPPRVNYFSGSGPNSIFNQTSTNSSFSTLKERVVNNFPVWAVSFLATPNLRFTSRRCFDGHLA